MTFLIFCPDNEIFAERMRISEAYMYGMSLIDMRAYKLGRPLSAFRLIGEFGIPGRMQFWKGRDEETCVELYRFQRAVFFIPNPISAISAHPLMSMHSWTSSTNYYSPFMWSCTVLLEH